ncbi:MAG: SEL1-like repeat protein, partial [Kiritimatiellia bacterium]|nr:SEL1-like repeat protein [Kiritimatiellia bacterium]
YQNGNGVTKDFTKAIELFRKAAKQGDAEAQRKLQNLGQQ